MRAVAMYPGSCLGCGGRIALGDRILFEEGAVYHERCEPGGDRELDLERWRRLAAVAQASRELATWNAWHAIGRTT